MLDASPARWDVYFGADGASLDPKQMEKTLIIGLAATLACTHGGGTGGTGTSSGTGPGTSSTETGGVTSGVTTRPTTGQATTEESGSTAGDQCRGGAYAPCLDPDGSINNALCGGNADTACLVDDLDEPTVGICTITMCETVADCICAPENGTAVPTCEEILFRGAKACVLPCRGGETCPDDAICQQGLCTFPRPAGGGTGTSTSG